MIEESKKEEECLSPLSVLLNGREYFVSISFSVIDPPEDSMHGVHGVVRRISGIIRLLKLHYPEFKWIYIRDFISNNRIKEGIQSFVCEVYRNSDPIYVYVLVTKFPKSKPEPESLNKHAADLGRIGGLKGGKSQSPKRQDAIQKMIAARWAHKKKGRAS